MVHTADITVSVSLVIILNSAEKIEKAEKNRYARIVTAPVLYWPLGVSNPGKLFYQ